MSVVWAGHLRARDCELTTNTWEPEPNPEPNPVAVVVRARGPVACMDPDCWAIVDDWPIGTAALCGWCRNEMDR